MRTRVSAAARSGLQLHHLVSALGDATFLLSQWSGFIQMLRAFRLAQLGDLEAWRLRGKVAKKLR